jgi:hypothetical protein
MDSDSTRWDKGGSVTENWQPLALLSSNRWSEETGQITLSNPCNYQMDQGVFGSVNTNGQFPDTYYSRVTDPSCAMMSVQRHILDKAYQVINEQTWRHDNTGVWRQ